MTASVFERNHQRM